MQFITVTMLFLAFLLPLLFAYKNMFKNVGRKRLLVSNLVSFGALCVCTLLLTVISAVAAPAAEQAAATVLDGSAGFAFIGAGLCTGLSCVGAGIAISAAASAALGAISENEKMFGKALIFVALAEGVAIYGLLISILILNRV